MWASASSAEMRLWSLPMRTPPVRSYIHIALPMARASLRLITPSFDEHRDEERQHLHQVRGVVAEALALGEGLVDEADVALLEVAQAAVDELRGLRRGAGGEVVALDERGAQAAGGGVERAADAGDAAADDQDVEVGVAEASECVGPVEGPRDHGSSLRRRPSGRPLGVGVRRPSRSGRGRHGETPDTAGGVPVPSVQDVLSGGPPRRWPHDDAAAPGARPGPRCRHEVPAAHPSRGDVQPHG